MQIDLVRAKLQRAPLDRRRRFRGECLECHAEVFGVEGDGGLHVAAGEHQVVDVLDGRKRLAHFVRTYVYGDGC